MKRRTVLKVVALNVLSSSADILKAVGHCNASATAWSAGQYKLRFFSEAENELLDKLMEMIIPADTHSAGAHAARVSLFADLMVATSPGEIASRWRNGLHLMREEAANSSLAEALARAASHEEHPTTDLEHFFTTLKQMTVNGYYTSEIGIHEDLQYVGNTYLASFPGCTHPEHKE